MLKLKIRPSGRAITIRYLAIALVLLVTLHYYLSSPVKAHYRKTWGGSRGKDRLSINTSSSSNETYSENGSYDNITDACGVPSGLERVVITVKTGATEAAEKVPTALRTTLRCAPFIHVFSDMAQDIGNTRVYNALDRIPQNVMEGNADFDLYRKQQELQDPEKIVSVLGDFHNPKAPSELAAWSLDKYKNIHILEKTWDLQPDMDWYFHVDADTYILWASLIAYIQRLDSSKESYLGSVAYVGDKPFAHGGSGILLSNAATRKLVVAHNGTAAHWDPKVHENCCGDWVLAQAFKEYDVDVQNVWPTINGESLNTIPFAADHWCQPVVTLHHITAAEAERVLRFEQERQDQSAPVLYAELFKDIVFDSIPDSREAWDNQARDETVPDIHSPEDCVQACAANSGCFSSYFDGQECYLGTSCFRYGEKKPTRGNRKVHSSWNRTRIDAWAAKQQPCTKVMFPLEG